MGLSEIRDNIDRVDQEIQKLFLERMALSEKVVSVKAEAADKIYKPDREKDIILRNSQDMRPDLVQEYQALIKRIMEVSRKYQYGRMLDLRDCFPFSYDKAEGNRSKGFLLKGEESLGGLFHVDQCEICSDYEEIASGLKDHPDFVGLTFMEKVGFGVNQAFQTFLAHNNLYINRCLVTREEIPQKCVMFSNHLIVLPDHNRFKIMFTTRNHSGALASILSMISDYHVNITEIHSNPVKLEKAWDYEFFLELSGNIDEKEMHSLLFQLSEETHFFKILGSYHCEGDFE